MVGLGQVYRESMRQMAGMTNLEVWYSRIEIEGIMELLEQHAAATGSRAEGAHGGHCLQGVYQGAHTKDSMKALDAS